MQVVGAQVQSDYRILVSRGTQRPRASLIAFTLRQPIPAFRLPLLPGDNEPEVALNRILHALYRRARFDLRLDYPFKDWLVASLGYDLQFNATPASLTAGTMMNPVLIPLGYLKNEVWLRIGVLY